MSGPKQEVVRFLQGRHALVSFAYPVDLPVAAEVCQSFVLDNGAFTAWKKGNRIDARGYRSWVRDWCLHPGFDWAVIPDCIDGSAADNDALIHEWCDQGLRSVGVPVWHMHESVQRLQALCENWPRVALGSSGQWRTPGASAWWRRMGAALSLVCDDEGRPPAKLHGLRMLNPAIFTRMPLASADSTNASMNAGSLSRFGMYKPPTAGQRATVIADRIEAQNSAATWTKVTDDT